MFFYISKIANDTFLLNKNIAHYTENGKTIFWPMRAQETLAGSISLKFCMDAPQDQRFWATYAIFEFRPQSWDMGDGSEGWGVPKND